MVEVAWFEKRRHASFALCKAKTLAESGRVRARMRANELPRSAFPVLVLVLVSASASALVCVLF